MNKTGGRAYSLKPSKFINVASGTEILDRRMFKTGLPLRGAIEHDNRQEYDQEGRVGSQDILGNSRE